MNLYSRGSCYRKCLGFPASNGDLPRAVFSTYTGNWRTRAGTFALSRSPRQCLQLRQPRRCIRPLMKARTYPEATFFLLLLVNLRVQWRVRLWLGFRLSRCIRDDAMEVMVLLVNNRGTRTQPFCAGSCSGTRFDTRLRRLKGVRGELEEP